MSASPDSLFTPFQLGSLTLKNRLAMAPMTRSFSPGGVPGDDVAAYYRLRAENDVALIITEGVGIAHKAAVNDPRVPHMAGEAALAGWKKVVDAVHAGGGKIMPQLWHVGAVRKPGDQPFPEANPASPSGLFKPGKQVAEPLSEREVEDVIAAYAQSAADAQRLGFDGIELHGAHGYLIDQFFWSGTNQRIDRFGGDLVGRTRFAVEVIKACRAAVGSDFPIMLRFSQWKQQDYEARLANSPQELEAFLAPLSAAGVDLFHCSQRRFWIAEFEGSDLNLAGWTKKLTGKPTMSVGSVGLDADFFTSFRGQSAGVANIDRLFEMMARGDFDMIAVGRALLSDPAWVKKVAAGRLQDCVPFTADVLKSLV